MIYQDTNFKLVRLEGKHTTQYAHCAVAKNYKLKMNWDWGQHSQCLRCFTLKTIFSESFSKTVSADHPVLISIWWENVKYLHCDGHDHDNAKENDAVFKTGPNCRW